MAVADAPRGPRLPQLPRIARPAFSLPAPMRAVADRVVALRPPLTPFGWTVLGLGAAAWAGAAGLGWDELARVAACSLVAVLIGAVMTLRRPGLVARTTLAADRVVVGDTAVARIVATPRGEKRSSGARVEVPVGLGRATFDIPAVAEGERWEDVFTIPTERRSALVVGPSAIVTGDPLSIARSEHPTGEPVTLYVHPRTVRLPGITSGWLRDLEGRTTQDLSTSDVAFHTLRRYEPGDDQRHVHWRSTAKLGQLMVRQFVDTRRSHLGLLVPASPADWDTEDEFEFALEVTASLGRAVLDESQDLTAIVGPHLVRGESATQLLDRISEAEFADRETTLESYVARAVPSLARASVVVLVVGATVDLTRARALTRRFPVSARTAVISCRPGAELSRRRIGRLTVTEIGSLEHLQRVTRVGGVG